jgi:hypothetical protein
VLVGWCRVRETAGSRRRTVCCRSSASSPGPCAGVADCPAAGMRPDDRHPNIAQTGRRRGSVTKCSPRLDAAAPRTVGRPCCPGRGWPMRPGRRGGAGRGSGRRGGATRWRGSSAS